MRFNEKLIQLIAKCIENEKSLKNTQERRNFLKKSAQFAFLSSTIALDLPFFSTKNKPKIAVVGAGIAGLTAAYTLKKGGITAKIFEASSRAGGRIFTKNNLFDGFTTEWGAELIDSSHTDMFRLINTLGLKNRLVDFEKDPLIRESIFSEGQFRTEKEIYEALKPVANKILKDQNAEGEFLQKIDNQSISEYLEKLNLPKWLYTLIDQTFTNLNGIESGNQSALNFLYVLTLKQQKAKILGESDERYKILGGNSLITDGLANILKGNLHYKHSLLAIRKKASGKVQLVFQHENKIIEENFDAVILTVPFTILRELELDFEMSPQKRNTILAQPYGTNTKFFMAFSERIWRKQGRQGYFLSDKFAGWDSSQAQNKNQGMGTLMCFLGGEIGKNALPETAEQTIKHCLAPINQLFPTAENHFLNQTQTANWHSNPLTKGSYSSFGVGQVLAMKDVGQQPCGNIFFAGEHCSFDFIGYMNGGAKTGREAAEKILRY